MSRKQQLRTQRAGTVINTTSKHQETHVIRALHQVVDLLLEHFRDEFTLLHENRWPLGSIVNQLRASFPDVAFHYHHDNTYIKPDGGILYLEPADTDVFRYPVLIAEVKNQGTNDARAKEGLPKQAKGNAIERLGKNVIGLRTALMRENIFPFVCFGYGCDFADDSSILDRVSTIAMFGELNKTRLHNEEGGRFNRGSFYFREEPWTIPEMSDIMYDIARRSILYYLSKYGEAFFQRSDAPGPPP